MFGFVVGFAAGAATMYYGSTTVKNNINEIKEGYAQLKSDKEAFEAVINQEAMRMIKDGTAYSMFMKQNEASTNPPSLNQAAQFFQKYPQFATPIGVSATA